MMPFLIVDNMHYRIVRYRRGTREEPGKVYDSSGESRKQEQVGERMGMGLRKWKEGTQQEEKGASRKVKQEEKENY